MISKVQLYKYIVQDPTVGLEQIAQTCPRCNQKALIIVTKSYSKDESDIAVMTCYRCGLRGSAEKEQRDQLIK